MVKTFFFGLAMTAPAASAAISVSAFPPSVGEQPTADLLAAVGLTGAVVEDFEDDAFDPSLTVSFAEEAGGVMQVGEFATNTIASVPDFMWEGRFWVVGATHDTLTAAPEFTQVAFDEPVEAVGFGLSGLQVDAEILVNGEVVTTVDDLGDGFVDATPTGRNGYIVLSGVGEELIESFAIRLEDGSADLYAVDTLAYLIPSPSTGVLAAALGLVGLRRRR